MNKIKMSLVMFMFLGLSIESFAGSASSLIFICHKGSKYTKAEVKYAFKGYLEEPRPIDNKALFSEMLSFISYTPEKYDKMWKKMYFRKALFVPKKATKEEEVINWVANNETGVGYVSSVPKHPEIEVCGQ